MLGVASPAFAHVTVQPGEASQGGFTTVAFQVPNERDDANTVQLEVTLPLDNPVAFVSTEPVPGWTIQVERSTLPKPLVSEDGEITEAVSKITWSGGSITPGSFQRFPVSVGPLPKTASLEFKAVQTYSNGEIVRWIDETPASGEEPEHPAPALKLLAAKKAVDTAATAAATAAVPKDIATTSDIDSAKTIAIIGIAVGALGLIVAIVALVRKPKPAS
ncbi:MAG: YcnI family protein [Actinobacteria bacterium]|nr:YcnI family protein [Actinomycetota bacterium]